MPWPHTVYRFTLQGPNWHHAEDFEPLTADDADYFPDFQSARAEIVHGISDSTYFSSVQDGVAVRVVHAEAWLKEVRIGRDKLTAKVFGLNPRGCRIELAGSPQVRKAQDVMRVGSVILPIPQDLPETLTVALTRGHNELDRAVYSTRYQSGSSPQVIIERELVEDRAADIDVPTAVSIGDTAQGSEAGAVSSPVVPTQAGIQTAAIQTHPKVFISYSHDSALHDARVLELANRPCRDGIDCQLDLYEESPPQGWPHWMEDQVEWAEFVLAVCTQTYNKRFRGQEVPGKGLGATWEGSILTQHVYNQAAQNATIIPVVFSPEDVAQIPLILQKDTRYNVSEGPDYDKLYRRLTNQPLIRKPPLGPIRKMP